MRIRHLNRRVPTMHIGAVTVMLLLTVNWAKGQHATPHADSPVRITMEALHAAGGVPPGWKFTLPQGNPEAGLEAFIELQCYVCHMVQGATFPATPARREPGPDLTGMGAHHPASYFAESIVNPNAVIVTGEGYTHLDGQSRMPDYYDISLGQLIDLVAYLSSLRELEPHGHHGSHKTKPSKGHDQGMHGHGSHHKSQ